MYRMLKVYIACNNKSSLFINLHFNNVILPVWIMHIRYRNC